MNTILQSTLRNIHVFDYGFLRYGRMDENDF